MALVQNESDIAANELTLRQVSSPFAESTVRPNNAFQLTPLRGPKIVGILVTDFVLTLVLTYGCGAAERWALDKKGKINETNSAFRGWRTNRTSPGFTERGVGSG